MCWFAYAVSNILEPYNVLCIHMLMTGHKNKLRTYSLTWLRNKILKGDDVSFT